MQMQREVERAKHKIRCLLKDKKDLELYVEHAKAQMTQLRMETYMQEERLQASEDEANEIRTRCNQLEAELVELREENEIKEQNADLIIDKCQDLEMELGEVREQNEDLHGQVVWLQDQVEDKQYEMEYRGAVIGMLEKQNRYLRKQERKLNATVTQWHTRYSELKEECQDRVSELYDRYSELEVEVAEVREQNENLKTKRDLANAQNDAQRVAYKQVMAEKVLLEHRLLAVERTPARNQDKRIESLTLKNVQLKEECELSVSKEQSLRAKVKDLKKKNGDLRKQLKRPVMKPQVQPKEHALEEMTQKQEIKRMSKHEKASKSRAKRMRRKAGQVQATSELAEDSSNMQPRCDAEAAPSEITALDVEDGEATLPDPSQSCDVSKDTNKVTCLSEGEVDCKDTKDEPLQRMEEAVNCKLALEFLEPTVQDSEDLPFGYSDTLPPSQQAEMVVQATEESAGITSPYADWIVDFPCMPADNTVPRPKKRRFFITNLMLAAERRALISRANNTITSYKQRSPIFRVLTNWPWKVIRYKNRRIANLKARVQILSELHEKGEEGFVKVSVDCQQICEQFIPRDSEIHQLIISQLPQTDTGQDCEHWFTVLQAELGLSTLACNSHNLQSVFQHWLSGRGNGPPIWKTLLYLLENSRVRELQRIAHFLQARLHEILPWSRLEISTDWHCIACDQLLPRPIQEEDKIFIPEEESNNTIAND